MRSMRVKGALIQKHNEMHSFTSFLFFPHFSLFVQRTNDNNLTFIRPFSSERIPSILQIKHLYIPHLCLIFFFFFFLLQLNRNLMQPILFFSHALGRLRTDNFNHASHKASAVSSLAPKQTQRPVIKMKWLIGCF